MISVIVPVYNVEKYVEECLESILSQTFTDLEILLIDDGSTDTSGKICDRFAARDARIRVIHTPNRGLAQVRNLGLEEAAGEWITFVDSDDTISPEYCRAMLDAAHAHGVDMVICDYTTRPGRLQLQVASNPRIDLLSPRQAIRDTLLQHGLHNSTWGHLYRRELFKGITYPKGRMYEDISTFHLIRENCSTPVAHLCLPLYFYRQHGSSYIHTFNSRRLDILTATDAIVEHYRSDPELLEAALDRRFSATFNLFLAASRAGSTDIAAQMWQQLKDRRRAELTRKDIRLKNRLGCLLTWLGPGVCTAASHLFSKYD